MPVTIPGIKRAEPQGGQSIGRVETPQINSKPQALINETFEKVLASATDIYYKSEVAAADNNLKELTNRYKTALYGDGPDDQGMTVNKFTRTPKVGQDVTGDYLGYKSYKQQLQDQILNDPMAQGIVAKKLRAEITDIDVLADRSVNVEYYDANGKRTKALYEADINNIKTRDLPAAVAFYNPKDPATREELIKLVNKAGASAATYLLKNEIKVDDPYFKIKVEEEIGTTAADAANYAVLARDTDKAEAILNDPYLKPVIPQERVKNTVAQIEKVKEERKIKDAVNRNLLNSEALGMENIKNDPTLSTSELKDTAMNEFLSMKTKLRESRLRDSSNAANQIAQYANELAAVGQLPATYELFSDDPKVSALLPLVTESSHLQRVRAALGVYPKDSDWATSSKIYEAFNTGEAYKWDQQKLKNEMYGLNKTDTKKYFDKYLKGPMGLKGPDRSKMVKSIKTFIRSGDWSGTPEAIWNKYFRFEIEKRFDALDNTLSTTEKEAYMNKWKPEFKTAYDAIRSADKEDRDAVAQQYFDMSLSEDEVIRQLNPTGLAPVKQPRQKPTKKSGDVDTSLDATLNQLER